jgi:multicomponent Na+:H+ antiporter subunit C
VTAAVVVGLLTAAGVYLVLQRGLIRVALGFILLGHAVNVLLVAAGGMAQRADPLLGRAPTAEMADPIPQAFVLTAIVITFGITVYLLALARAGGETDPAADAAEPVTDGEADPTETDPSASRPERR